MIKFTLQERLKILIPLAAALGGFLGYSTTYVALPLTQRLLQPKKLEEIRSLEQTPQVQRYLHLTWATPGLRNNLLENSVITEPLHSGYVSGALLGTLLGGWYILRTQRTYEESIKQKEEH